MCLYYQNNQTTNYAVRADFFDTLMLVYYNPTKAYSRQIGVLACEFETVPKNTVLLILFNCEKIDKMFFFKPQNISWNSRCISPPVLGFLTNHFASSDSSVNFNKTLYLSNTRNSCQIFLPNFSFLKTFS